MYSHGVTECVRAKEEIRNLLWLASAWSYNRNGIIVTQDSRLLFVLKIVITIIITIIIIIIIIIFIIIIIIIVTILIITIFVVINMLLLLILLVYITRSSGRASEPSQNSDY